MDYKIISVVSLLPFTCYGQGLFDIAPNDEAQESSPKINWTVGVNAGYDDNLSSSANGDGSSYISAFVGANAVRITPRSSLEYYLRYSANYHDEPVQGGSSQTNNFSGGVNWSHRFNERLRVASRLHVGYELEPDYNYGFANTRAINEYWYWNFDNSVGYRWNERFATYAGLNLSGVNYGSDNSVANRVTTTPYIQGRYQLSPKTVLTGSYRYSLSNNNSRSDSASHIVTGGIERRLSETSVVVARAGFQLHDVDGGDNTFSPYFEAAWRNRLSEKTVFRTYARYSITDYDTSFNGGSYDVNTNLRFGFALNHSLSTRLQLHGGASYIYSDYKDSPNGLPDEDANLANFYAGFSYQVARNMYLTGSVNHTIAVSDITARDYTRNRYGFGLRYSW